MKYMLQVRFNGADAVIGGLPAAEREKVTAEFEAIRTAPGVLDGNQLEAASAATTVRVSGGRDLADEAVPGPPGRAAPGQLACIPLAVPRC